LKKKEPFFGGKKKLLGQRKKSFLRGSLTGVGFSLCMGKKRKRGEKQNPVSPKKKNFILSPGRGAQTPVRQGSSSIKVN